MIKVKKKINNPMTVIALFATLSETSAAISLPFLGDDEKEIYVWFLISFPFYLLLLFFATLNFNYRSLYAPSDFEKEEHFLKSMDNIEPEKSKTAKLSSKSTGSDTTINGRRANHPQGHSQDVPIEIGLQSPLSVQYHIRVPELLKDLYIIDARRMSKKMEFSAVLEKVHRAQENAAQIILFLTCAKSETLMKESALKHSKQTKRRDGAPFCIAYNLNSHGVTVIDQAGQLTTSTT